MNQFLHLVLFIVVLIDVLRLHMVFFAGVRLISKSAAGLIMNRSCLPVYMIGKYKLNNDKFKGHGFM